MYIISKFDDYYDIGKSLGIDKTIMYKRTCEPITDKNELTSINDGVPVIDNMTGYAFNNKSKATGTIWRDFLFKHILNIDDQYILNKGKLKYIQIIGFCGKIYTGVYLPTILKNNESGGSKYFIDDHITGDGWLSSNPKDEVIHKGSVYYHDSEDFQKHLEYFEKCEINKSKRPTISYFRDNIEKIINAFKYFASMEPIEHSKIFNYFEVPIFKINPYVMKEDVGSKGNSFGMYMDNDCFIDKVIYVIKNPKLSDLEFYKAVDPFQAFQEISMYITGVLGVPEKETVEISDSNMRDAKGFDDKSFKMRKGTKKPRRKAKK